MSFLTAVKTLIRGATSWEIQGDLGAKASLDGMAESALEGVGKAALPTDSGTQRRTAKH